MNFLRRLWVRIAGGNITDTISIREGVMTRRSVINGRHEVETRQMTEKDFIIADENFAAMNKIHEKMMKQFEEGK